MRFLKIKCGKSYNNIVFDTKNTIHSEFKQVNLSRREIGMFGLHLNCVDFRVISHTPMYSVE